MGSESKSVTMSVLADAGLTYRPEGELQRDLRLSPEVKLGANTFYVFGGDVQVGSNLLGVPGGEYRLGTHAGLERGRYSVNVGIASSNLESIKPHAGFGFDIFGGVLRVSAEGSGRVLSGEFPAFRLSVGTALGLDIAETTNK